MSRIRAVRRITARAGIADTPGAAYARCYVELSQIRTAMLQHAITSSRQAPEPASPALDAALERMLAHRGPALERLAELSGVGR